MPVSKLTCPECGKVLRPAKPVAVGKKVRCPKCDTIFPAEVDDDERDYEEEEEARPRKKAPSAKPKPKAAPAAKKEEKKSSYDDDDVGTYGYVKEDAEEEEESKPKISYAPNTKIKDLRGPAMDKIVVPSNHLLRAGIIGTLGWLFLIFIIVIPAVFPIKEEKKEDTTAPSSASAPPPKKEEKKGQSFFEIWGINLAGLAKHPFYIFIPSLLPFALGALYSAVTTMGAVKMQNLESRQWGFAGSIMAIIPLNAGGVSLVVMLVVNFLFYQIDMEPEYTTFILILVAALISGASAVAGILCIRTLMDEDVIAGFEYVPD